MKSPVGRRLLRVRGDDAKCDRERNPCMCHGINLLLHKLVQGRRAHACCIDIAFGIGGHTFCQRDCRVTVEIGNERPDAAVSGAADPDAALDSPG
jgi:hypothetical protein